MSVRQTYCVVLHLIYCPFIYLYFVYILYLHNKPIFMQAQNHMLSNDVISLYLYVTSCTIIVRSCLRKFWRKGQH